MRRTTRLTSAGFTFLCLFVSAAIEAGEMPPPDLAGQVQQAFCFSSHNEYSEPAMYFSDVFEIRVPKSAGIWYPGDMASVFVSYLKQQRGYAGTPNPTVFCSLHDTVQMAQGSKDLLAADHRYRKQPIVETGWKMTAQQAEAAAASAATAPTDSTAAKPNAAVTIHGYCIGHQGPKAFFSAVFSSPREVTVEVNVVDKNGPTADRWAQSFDAYLAREHGGPGAARCFGFEALNGAQLNWSRQLRIASAFGPNGYVQTGWTYQLN